MSLGATPKVSALCRRSVRISPWVSRVLSDLSVIGEVEWRISLHQPGISLHHPMQQEELSTVLQLDDSTSEELNIERDLRQLYIPDNHKSKHYKFAFLILYFK